MNFLLDTNVLLIYLRDRDKRTYIENTYNIFSSDKNTIISVVTLGEIRSIALRNYWGGRRIEQLNGILKGLIIADINSEDVIERYAEIEAFSQGRSKQKKLLTSSRNMGKNDLWIAATTSVLGANLLTTDKDFDHLNGVFLNRTLLNLTTLTEA